MQVMVPGDLVFRVPDARVVAVRMIELVRLPGQFPEPVQVLKFLHGLAAAVALAGRWGIGEPAKELPAQTRMDGALLVDAAYVLLAAMGNEVVFHLRIISLPQYLLHVEIVPCSAFVR